MSISRSIWDRISFDYSIILCFWLAFFLINSLSCLSSSLLFTDVNRLLKEFEKQKRMMKQLMKGKGPFGKGPKGGRGIMRMPGM